MTHAEDPAETPYDITAERALIGTAILAPNEVRDLFLAVGPEDWYYRQTRDLAAVIQGMMRADKPIDENTVHVEALTRGLMPGRVSPTFLLDCFRVFRDQPAAAHIHAQRIKELAAARKLNGAGERLMQRTRSSWETGMDGMDLAAHIRETRRALDEAEQTLGELEFTPPTGILDFLDSLNYDHDWLVPGLLERMDRIVVTGAEGGGKSWLCSQMALTLAAALHPFTGHQLGAGNYTPRVLIVDCENSARQSGRRISHIMGMVNARRRDLGLSEADWNNQLAIEIRPAGIDLLAGTDTAWLERTIATFSPDLLVLGPLYKLHHENPNDEKPAREIAWVIDGLRERYKFALLSEAHAGKSTTGDGKRNMAPIGSSVWLRWPEFGFGLRRADDDPGKGRASVVDVVSWRGSREERQWPSKLQHSPALPWMPADPDYYNEVRDALNRY